MEASHGIILIKKTMEVYNEIILTKKKKKKKKRVMK